MGLPAAIHVAGLVEGWIAVGQTLGASLTDVVQGLMMVVALVELVMSQALLRPLIADLVLAAALATFMSTFSSQLIVCSSALVEDIFTVERVRVTTSLLRSANRSRSRHEAWDAAQSSCRRISTTALCRHSRIRLTSGPRQKPEMKLIRAHLTLT